MTVGLLAVPARSYADPVQPAPLSHPQTTLVLLVDFNDIQMQKTDEFWRDRVFSLDVDSVNRYYNETTYGTHQFLPAAETYEVENDGVVHVTLARNHPDAGRDTWSVSGCVIDAVTAADPYVDFAAFDANGDGVLDTDELHLAVVLAGYETSDSRADRPGIWAHANLGGLSWRDCRPDDVQLTTYIAQGELINDVVGPNGIGTVAHELGHCLGLPDLYDTTGASIGLGTSSLMANGAGLSCGAAMDGSSPAHLDPWSLIQIGAREPQVVTQDATVILHGSTTPDYNIVKVPITDDGSQYFLLENRITEGYDRGLRDDRHRGGAASGVAIYHVDEWVIDVWDPAIYGTNRGVNSNYLRKAVALEESDGPALDLPWDSPQGGDHYFYEGHHTVFGPETYPDTGAYVDTLTNGTTRPTGIRIVIEGESGDERMKAHITFGSTATAEGFAGGDGSYARPYQIATKTQLDMVRRHPDAHFVLVDDLEFTGADFEAGGAFYNRGKGFRPLFGSGTFRGSFDGAGHSITGLRIDASGTADIYAGLFGTLQGTVKDLDLVEATVSATSVSGVSHAGGIAGRVQEGLLSGCSVSGSVTADWAGGIVGHARGTAIRGCRNRAAVESQALDLWGNAGGIAGEAFRTTISTCGNEGDVTAQCRLTAAPEPDGCHGLGAAGGIVGRLGGHGCKAGITRCFNTGRITALNWTDYPWCSVPSAGGIVGRVDGGRPATVADCYNTGLVSTSYMGGGIVGDVGKASAPSIARCYSIGDFQSATVGDYSGYVGGVVGRVQSEYDDVITDCFFLATDACPDGVNWWRGDSPPPAQDPTTPCTDEEMRTQERYDGFDFDDVWVLADASGYPYPQLRAQRQALELPGAPTTTAVASGYDGVKLTWSAVPGATGYEVYRALDTGGPWGLIAATGLDRRSLTDTGLATGTAYHYRVCAVTTDGGLTVRGADSEPATATPALAEASGLKLRKASATSIKASWKAVPGATGYQLWRAKAAKGKYVLAKTTGKLTVTDLKLARKAPHFYKVRAYRLVGGVRVFGDWSPVAKIKL